MIINSSQAILYIAIDGDDVGSKLRTFIISDDIEGARNYSNLLTDYFTRMASDMAQTGANVIFCGGDSILASADDETILKFVMSLSRPQIALSGGIGETPEMAYLALQLAKARGKGRIVQFQGVTGKTVKLFK